MKSSTRIIFQAVIPMVLISWAALIAVTLLMSTKDEFSKLGVNNYNLATTLNYLLFTTPRRAYDFFVYSGAIGFIIGLGTLAQSSELIAMQSVGISRRGIALRGLLALALITVVVMIGAEMWGSYGDRRATQLVAQAQGRNVSFGSNSGLWIKDGGSFINARTVVVDANGQPSALWSVRILQFNEATKDQGAGLSRVISAKSAKYLGEKGWLLLNVNDQRFTQNTGTTISLDQLTWASKLEPEQIAARAIQPGRLSVLELYRNIQFARNNQLDDRVFVSAIWQRLCFPLTVLSLALAGAPFVFGSLRSGGLGRSIFLGLLVSIGFFMIERLITGMVDTFKWSHALGNLLPPFALGAWGWWRLARR